jgi:hypothetical protein
MPARSDLHLPLPQWRKMAHLHRQRIDRHDDIAGESAHLQRPCGTQRGRAILPGEWVGERP